MHLIKVVSRQICKIRTMKAVKSFLVFILLAHLAANAQPKSGVYLSLNPLGVLEPQTCIGGGIALRLNDDIEVSGEYSSLSSSLFLNDYRFTDVVGSRSVVRIKYTISTNEEQYSRVFIGAEARFKNFTHADVASFTNQQTGVVTKDFAHKNTVNIRGYGAIIGKQFDLGYLSNWSIEFTAGVGLRFKNTHRSDVPNNSYIIPKDIGFGETPNYLENHTSLYFPVGFRVMLRL